MYCFWIHNKSRKGSEVHHVFGRGRCPGDIKEKYTSLMTVCRDCHPEPILAPTSSEWKNAVLYVWRKMNTEPVGDIHTPDGTLIESPFSSINFKVTDI